MQPVPKAAYCNDFRENTNFCPQRDSDLGPLAQQASVLPLYHCDLQVDSSSACVFTAIRDLHNSIDDDDEK